MYLHNTSNITKYYLGTETAADGFYLITDAKHSTLANTASILSDILSGELKISLDGTTNMAGSPTDHLNRLKNPLPVAIDSTQYPFASKKLADGKKLFRRVHGISAAVSTTQSSHKFTIPFTSCKITGVEIIGAETGDFVDLNILDTATGTVSSIPNYKLNQFGFNVYLAADYHQDTSNYDADLFAGLQIEIWYTSISTKTVYFNYILHEVVSA